VRELGRNVAVVLSGGNVDIPLLLKIALERGGGRPMSEVQ
jgi:hypothetical protein